MGVKAHCKTFARRVLCLALTLAVASVVLWQSGTALVAPLAAAAIKQTAQREERAAVAAAALPSGRERREGWQCCLDTQRQRLLDSLRTLIDPGHPVVLVGQPVNANLGDNTIWEGELRAIQALGLHHVPPEPTCTVYRCDVAAVGAALGANGTLLLHGGGNFGDLYRRHGRLRIKLVQAFPGHRVLLLPQSVMYRNSSRAAAEAAAFAAHSSLTLLTRDSPSLATLQALFPATRRVLTPDAAFAIGHLPPACEPTADVVLLLREDIEATAAQHAGREAALQQLRDRNVSYVAGDWRTMPQTKPISNSDPVPSAVAAERLATANSMLCVGRVVVTDRLHAMLLALLMGRPCVAFDNAIGKLSAYRGTHLDPEPDCAPRHTRSYMVAGVHEAVAKALALLGEPGV